MGPIRKIWKVKLKICGVVCDVRINSINEFTAGLHRRYEAFISRSEAHARIEMIPVRDRLGEVLISPRVCYFRGGEVVRISRHDFKGNLSFCTSGNRRLAIGKFRVLENPYAFDNLLRTVYSVLLLCRGGFLIHACGLKVDKNGYLFPGPTESGKTTLARKAIPGSVLSDELVGILIRGARPTIHATPFWGDFQKCDVNASAYLRGIWFLEKMSTTQEAKHLATSEALSRLLSLIVFYSDQRGPNEMLLSLSGRLLTAVPAFTFTYGLEESIDSILERARKAVSECAAVGSNLRTRT